jgi:hypothetical protein|nr:hypothetical protein Q903MT_gene1794 [Picea sitchensis]
MDQRKEAHKHQPNFTLEKDANKTSWEEVKVIVLTSTTQTNQQSGVKRGRPDEQGEEVSSELIDKRETIEHEDLEKALMVYVGATLSMTSEPASSSLPEPDT